MHYLAKLPSSIKCRRCVIRQWPAVHTCWNMSPIILRCRRCATRQCTCGHTHWSIRDRFITQEMCNEAVEAGTWPWVLRYVPGQYKPREMCSKVMRMDPWLLKVIPDRFKIKEMCDKVVVCSPYTLRFSLISF